MVPESVARKLTTILASDVVGYSRLTGADEELTLARLRTLRSDLIDPIISIDRGRVVKRTGDGALVEFASVVDAVRCAIEVQNGMVERNSGIPPERRIEFRIGIHLGDVMVESDGDLMGDGVNIAARLEGICAPGQICLSEDAYRQVRSRLDLAVSDLGNRELKNIVEPVHVYSLEVGKPATAKPVGVPAKATGQGKRRALVPILAVAAALLIIAAVAAWYFPGRSPNLAANAPAHLSVVVLPFANLSNDPNQDYFADGITDNLTTDLSRIRGSFVIARNTAFTFKGKNVDAKQIGKDLDVRYVLEGSVQRDGNRVRVNAQLIDAQSGSHLWADRFEEDLADLFKLQDDVVARLANTLGYELVKAEAEKSAHSTNPDSIDLTMLGWAALNRAQHNYNREQYEKVHEFFERALKLDPKNVDALIGITRVETIEFAGNFTPELHREKSAAEFMARIIALDPQNGEIYGLKAFLLFYLKQVRESLTAAERAIELDPNNAAAYAQLSADQGSLGDNENALLNIDRAMRLSPLDPNLSFWHFVKGKALLFLRRYDAAIREFNEAEREGVVVYIVPTFLASALALDNQFDTARDVLARARKMNPALTISWLKGRVDYPDIVYDGLRKAGLPEDASPPPPKHLSIVVLPFNNLSGDPKQDYFADGITDNLTTDLSRIRNSFVIARNTAFTFKDKNLDAKEIGKELGVRYVLEGSVQRDDTRVRVNARLIEAETGNQVWAQAFDSDRSDLLRLEDDVTQRIAQSLNYEIIEREAAGLARERSINLSAADLAMQGWAAFFRQYTVANFEEARKLFGKSLETDPDNVDALVGLANVDALAVANNFVKDPKETMRESNDAILRALRIDPSDARAHLVRGLVLRNERNFDAALAAFEKAAQLDPGMAPVYPNLGFTLILMGRFQESVAPIQEGIRLSPRDPSLPAWLMFVAWANLFQGKLNDSLEWALRAESANPNYSGGYLFAAPAYALLGRMAEAHDTVTKLLSIAPKETIKGVRSRFSARPDYMKGEAIFENGLRKAGLPEE